MGDAQEQQKIVKVDKLLKNRAGTTKEAKRCLGDIAMLTTGYCLTVLGEIYKDREVTAEDIKSIFESLKPIE